MMNDLAHYWSGDLSTGNTGDLALVSGTLRGQQRVLRRLLTNPGDYIFQPKYGAGLPAWVGLPMDVGKVTALIRSQILLEDAVARVPAPVITVKQGADLVSLAVDIAYNDAATDTPTVLSFNVSA
jgi:phage baseplate assembly protein W